MNRSRVASTVGVLFSVGLGLGLIGLVGGIWRYRSENSWLSSERAMVDGAPPLWLWVTAGVTGGVLLLVGLVLALVWFLTPPQNDE